MWFLSYALRIEPAQADNRRRDIPGSTISAAVMAPFEVGCVDLIFLEPLLLTRSTLSGGFTHTSDEQFAAGTPNDRLDRCPQLALDNSGVIDALEGHLSNGVTRSAFVIRRPSP